MADRPIIFSGPMVKAILAGRKTMTRRILKGVGELDRVFQMDDGSWHVCDSRGEHMSPVKIPYAVGDRLWVREAWRTSHKFGNDSPRVIAWQAEEAGYKETWAPLIYEADGHKTNWAHDDKPGKLRPPIHMPRWASRITLAVTAVKIERGQDIPAKDTIAEGVQCDTCEAMRVSACHDSGCFASLQLFRELWNSLHGPGAWARNDWVAAISFERTNADQA